MSQTEFPTVLSQYMYDLLYENRLPLVLEDVWEGDQNLIPRVPAICIVMGDYKRTLSGAPFRTDNEFTIYLMVYHGGVRDNQLNYRECNERAEAIMTLLHTDKTMGDNVIHGYVTGMEPGYQEKKTLMYVTRITWQGLTKTLT